MSMFCQMGDKNQISYAYATAVHVCSERSYDCRLKTTCMFTLMCSPPTVPPHAASRDSLCSCMSSKSKSLWTGWQVTYTI